MIHARRIARSGRRDLAVFRLLNSVRGRAALLSVTRPEVRSAAALAPCVYPTDVPAGVDGHQILIVHGSADRLASPGRSAALAAILGRQARVGCGSVGGARTGVNHRTQWRG